jgi:hypothetical protein
MQYFRFEIPLNEDGTRVSYSPGWHGVLDKCPSKVTVSLYNDKEGYGIAMTEDTAELPRELTVLTKAEHDKILAEVKDEAMVYTADKMTSLFTIKPNKGTPILVDRGVYIPGSIIVDDKYVMPEPVAEPSSEISTATQKAYFCPTCHVFITNLPSNLIANKISLTCPNGHEAVFNGK